MRKHALLFLTAVFILLNPIQGFSQKMAIFTFPVEIELTNDQGDMPTKDYLKNYGTKGKQRGIEYIYQVTIPFLHAQFKKHNLELLSTDTLSTFKANEYGHPAAVLSKVVSSGIADQYLRIHIKDIGTVAMEGVNQTDPFNRQRKIVKIRCRIQVYDNQKNLIKEVESEFHSGDKVENPTELGVDLRRTAGTEYEQELKVYETCTKMAVLRAVKQLAG
jgi:hypothetical protein